MRNEKFARLNIFYETTRIFSISKTIFQFFFRTFVAE